MTVSGVDPRDTRWEVDDPAYRVYLWHRPPAPDGVCLEDTMWHRDGDRPGLIRLRGVDPTAAT